MQVPHFVCDFCRSHLQFYVDLGEIGGHSFVWVYPGDGSKVLREVRDAREAKVHLCRECWTAVRNLGAQI